MDTEPNAFDEQMERLLKAYHGQKKKGSVGVCPASDDLLDYIEGRSPEARRSRIEQHLPFCERCQHSVLYFKASAMEINEPAPAWEAFQQKLPADPRPKGRKGWAAWIERWRPRPLVYWVPAGVGLAMALLAVALNLVPSQWARLSYVDREQALAILNTRSASVAGDAGRLKDYYRQGLEALLAAQVWKLKRVDEAKVNEAIDYFRKANALAAATQNEAYAAECRFYLGKAYLKKKDFAEARHWLEAFKQFGGSNPRLLRQQQEADQILAALEHAQ